MRLLGPRILCQQSWLDKSSEDEDNKMSSDEDVQRNAWNLFLDVVGQSRSGMRVDGFLEDEELARTLRE